MVTQQLPDVEMCIISEGGGRKVGENKLLTQKKNRSAFK